MAKWRALPDLSRVMRTGPDPEAGRGPVWEMLHYVVRILSFCD